MNTYIDMRALARLLAEGGRWDRRYHSTGDGREVLTAPDGTKIEFDVAGAEWGSKNTEEHATVLERVAEIEQVSIVELRIAVLEFARSLEKRDLMTSVAQRNDAQYKMQRLETRVGEIERTLGGVTEAVGYPRRSGTAT